jgi:hypothetical protein
LKRVSAKRISLWRQGGLLWTMKPAAVPFAHAVESRKHHAPGATLPRLGAQITVNCEIRGISALVMLGLDGSRRRPC